MGSQARIPPRIWQQVAESCFHSATTSVFCPRPCKGAFGTHSARAGVLADMPARAFTCPRKPCAPDPVGVGVAGCFTGVSVCQAVSLP